MIQHTTTLHFNYVKDSQDTTDVSKYQTAAYEFKDVDYSLNLFSFEELADIYLYKES